ncbi:MAG TPA: 3-oxoacyl-[acyl-carrier-protein] synthase III C-terminal domain-containing protein [Bryobacteraceae bacterium]|nr:3-oxoacyl-[acyl-carrier-protein] synthase III C-terminal domain-containing protein [Bryobacteraceae bacterium]
MKIISAASAFPPYYYSQDLLCSALSSYWDGRLPNADLLRRLYSNACVEGRHLARPIGEYYGMRTFGEFNRTWMESAEQLGASALCTAVNRAGVSRTEIGALFFVSVTGISSPSIDSRLIEKLWLTPSTKRIPIFGLGCVAGAAGIARAADYVKAYPSQVAALVSVELCSLTLQRDDLSVANLISSGLFGDGAAAVLVAGDDFEQPGPEIIDTRSTLYSDTQDAMGWKISEKGFEIVLSPEVPRIIREHLGQDVDAFLASHDLCRDDIGAWILHTGGPKILEATQDSLGLTREDLKTSWDCLRSTGNLSSASVLCVLEQFMTRIRPEPGTWSILAAMGPGFCSELVLLRW